jgi:hypothetical protein
MEFAAWTYPWDVVDETPAVVADRLREIGVTEINLATNYHTVNTFLPHNPQRRMFFASASSYFRPDDRYGHLEPVPHPEMTGDWVETIADGLPDAMSLTSWTIGSHNSRLGDEHRDCCIENAHGDDLVFGLCPSNDAVADYLVNVVGDLADRDHFGSIELETFDYFYGTGLGWHHQKIHADLGTLGEFLFGLCFCEDCRENARDAGVDVDAARETVRETVDAIVSGDVGIDDPEGWMDDHPTVAAYAAARERTLEAVFERLADASGEADLGYYAGMTGPGTSWMFGADLERLGDHVDYYVAPVYEGSREAVLDGYETIAGSVGDTPLHAGILPGHPPIDDEETVVDIVDGLHDAGVERLSFYNYGLLPDHALDWIGTATAEYR